MEYQPKHFWEYETVPPSGDDLVKRILVGVFTRLYVGAVKPSRPWTWQRFSYPENFEGHFVEGDPSASYSVLQFSRWGWQQVRVIQPDLALLDPDRRLLDKSKSTMV
jgi:hypothetical protein